MALLLAPPAPFLVSFRAERVRSAGDGAVRTTVPVSLRGTAWRVASAAWEGVTPTAVGGVEGAGALAFCPAALRAVSASAPPQEIILM